ncbi:pyruvate dehydrogenase X component [Coprinopsis marcescibilis]|uniref:Pyruvate dehydrogenase X component n=1 Tax=Coprinopsis marcescibilis TaxID=230819 RepID=A0A5C3L3U8_COPMA|nr:pyruvate dehydrogenase X component [Coprinopsis marcescibilis]
MASALALRAARLSSVSARHIHSTARRHVITHFQMPAMSPTMTEGGVSSWKKQDGEHFSAGEVLLEIETDKATIDVEAQEDGVMGKILVPDGTKNVPVGKLIALLAEEGDDIHNLEIPKEEPTKASSQPAEQPAAPSPPPPSEPPAASQSSSSSAPQHHGPLPSHSRPLFPSVHRLIIENNIQDLGAIKGTGVRGMITKGDVLAYLGKASGPNGTFKPGLTPIQEATQNLQKKVVEEVNPLDGDAIRRLIVNSMLQQSNKARNPVSNYKNADFDSIIADYLPASAKPTTPKAVAASEPSKVKKDFLDGLY